MARPDSPAHRASARVVLGIVVLTALPFTARAGEIGAPPARPAPLRTALAAARVAPPPAIRRAAPRAQAANPATQSPAFFKTRTGILVAGVMAVGAGYAIYSTQHDRIHSPGKQ